MTREPYAYAGDNPANVSDPSGLCWPWCTALIGAAVGVGLYVGISLLTHHPITTAGVVGSAAAGALAGVIGPWAGGAIAGALGIDAAAGTLGAVATSVTGGAVTGMVSGAANCLIQGHFPSSMGGTPCTAQRLATYMATGAMFGSAGGLSGAGYSAEFGPVIGDDVSAEAVAAWTSNQTAIGCFKGFTNWKLTGSPRPF
jgi:hypothetical protein